MHRRPHHASIRAVLAAIAIMAAGHLRPPVALAQHNGPAYRDRFSIARADQVRPIVDLATRRDFRWEGTIVGGLAVGILGGIEGAAYCGNSENGSRNCAGTTIAFAAGGAAIGAIAGHPVGRLFHRT